MIQPSLCYSWHEICLLRGETTNQHSTTKHGYFHRDTKEKFE